MSLLIDLSTDALDPGYAAAAARKRASGEPQRPRWSLVGATVVAATLVIVIAAVQTRASAPAAAKSRSALIAAVDRQSATVDKLEKSLAALSAQQAALRDATLAETSAGSALASRIAAEELALGTLPVTGPGLRVTVADAATSSAGTAGTGRNRVLDRDLQEVVNALWTAGAEAIAVNGQRLTGQSAIRQAGDAVLVDFRPLVSPYVITAIGPPVDLETGFGASATAARMRGYAQLYGLRFGYARAGRLSLPAATDVTLRFAHPAPVPSPRGHT